MSPGTAVYLYGVIRDGDPLVLDVPPISDAGADLHALAPWPGCGAER